MSKEVIKWIMAGSIKNKALVELGGRFGCACCMTLFTSDLITNFIPEKSKSKTESLLEWTAVCPLCGIDAMVHETQAICMVDEGVWNDRKNLKAKWMAGDIPSVSLVQWKMMLAELNDMWFNPDHGKQGEDE